MQENIPETAPASACIFVAVITMLVIIALILYGLVKLAFFLIGVFL